MLFELDNVAYRYPDGTPALESITFGIAEGDHVVILGSNGSGKTTLLRLINGLIFPTSGAFRFNGRDVTEKMLGDPKFRTPFRQTAGFVFQNAEAQLFNATVSEELAFGPRQLGLTEAEIAERVHDVLNFLGIAHLADRPPFRMSGGEKRKVAIASILTMNPDVILFDEPFLGLDPRSRAWLVATIQQLQAAGKTTIIATHTLDMIERIASKMILLSEEHTVASVSSVEEGLRNVDVLRRANLIEVGGWATTSPPT